MYFATQTIINCGFTYLHSAIDHHGIFRGEWVSARVIDFSAFPIPQFVNGTPKWPRRWLGEDKGQKINTQSRPLIWSTARPTPLPIRHTCCDDGRPLQRMSFLCLFCVSKDDINTPCPPADKFNWTPIINHGNIDLSCFLRVPRTHTHTHTIISSCEFAVPKTLSSPMWVRVRNSSLGLRFWRVAKINRRH